MHILIAPDKFKGSLTAPEVCKCIREGILKHHSGTQFVEMPMADGGEGSVEILRESMSLEPVPVLTRDPLGRPILAHYYRNDTSAFIEMAAASGMELLAEKERNPLFTSSFGTGLMIADAMNSGVGEIFLFIGGSATNDGGMGMAAALGYRFLDWERNVLEPIGKNLGNARMIDRSRVNMKLSQTRIRVICDVENPFFGPEGAAHVYAAQKGAAPQDILALDEGLRSFAGVVRSALDIDISERKGSGAAGGAGGGAIAFMGAKLIPGVDFMMDILGAGEAIRSADLIVTGEGKIDHQTLYGKVVSGIASRAKKHKKPCIAFCGISELSEKEKNRLGLMDIIPMSGDEFSLEESLDDPERVLEEVVSRYFSGRDSF